MRCEICLLHHLRLSSEGLGSGKGRLLALGPLFKLDQLFHKKIDAAGARFWSTIFPYRLAICRYWRFSRPEEDTKVELSDSMTIVVCLFSILSPQLKSKFIHLCLKKENNLWLLQI